MNMTMNLTRVITGPAVFSYLTVNEPKVPLGGGRPKYSVSLIIPKTDTATIDKIQAAIRAAYAEGQAKLMKDYGSVPPLDEWRSGAFRQRGISEQLLPECQQCNSAGNRGREPEAY